jgi:hypothetical protein
LALRLGLRGDVASKGGCQPRRLGDGPPTNCVATAHELATRPEIFASQPLPVARPPRLVATPSWAAHHRVRTVDAVIAGGKLAFSTPLPRHGLGCLP